MVVGVVDLLAVQRQVALCGCVRRRGSAGVRAHALRGHRARALTRRQVFSLSPYSTVSGRKTIRSGKLSQCFAMCHKYVCPSLPTLGSVCVQATAASGAAGF